jgi:hypothetical protein
MSSKYLSFKFKTSHFNISNIQDYLQANIPSYVEYYEQNSLLSSDKLNTIIPTLFSKTFFFDKMQTNSKDIEKIKYIYLSSVDSNMNFISSCDSEMNINGTDLYHAFYQELNDSNSNYFVDSTLKIKYNCFELNSFYFIGILFEMASHSVMVIIETYNDDSVVYDTEDIKASEIDYGFPIFSENQVFLKQLQDPNTSMFEYAS